MTELIKPRLEGSVGLPDGRRMGFAEFGDARGRTVIWLHGTPGARRQIPHEARALAMAQQVRLVGIDRPGIGSSTPHVYSQIRSFATDLESGADALGIEGMAIIGLSGGGPSVLGAALGEGPARNDPGGPPARSAAARLPCARPLRAGLAGRGPSATWSARVESDVP